MHNNTSVMANSAAYSAPYEHDNSIKVHTLTASGATPRDDSKADAAPDAEATAIESESGASAHGPSPTTATAAAPPTEAQKATPLPMKKVAIVFLIQFCEAFTGSSLFPYIGFMVKDFSMTDDEKHLGYYAGFLASSFFLAQFFSSFYWGYLSDKYGRRPVLLVGLIGTFISINLFGLSRYYWWAVASRFLTGILNGNIGVVKTYLGEVTDTTNQARAFSMIGLVGGLGSIVGPMAGGYLVKPADNFAFFRKIRFFTLFPYYLPCLLCAMITIVGFVIGCIFLTETRVPPPQPPRQSRSRSCSPSRLFWSLYGKTKKLLPVSTTEDDLENNTNGKNNNNNNGTNGTRSGSNGGSSGSGGDGAIRIEAVGAKAKQSIAKAVSKLKRKKKRLLRRKAKTGTTTSSSSSRSRSSSSGINSNGNAKKKYIHLEEDEEEEVVVEEDDCDYDDDDDDDEQEMLEMRGGAEIEILEDDYDSYSNNDHNNNGNNSSSSSSRNSSRNGNNSNGAGTIIVVPTITTTSTIVDNPDASGVEAAQQAPVSATAVLKDRTIVLSCVLYALLGFIYTVFDEVFPLWSLVRADDGGLGFTSNDIGITASVGGVWVVMFQLFICPAVTKRLGVVRTFRLGILMGAIPFLLLPLVSYLSPHRTEYPWWMPSGVMAALSSNAKLALCWIALILLYLTRVSVSQLAFTSVMIFINNSANSAEKGSANGLGQSLVALTRATGPALGAIILAFTMSSGMPFPFNHYFVFFMITALLGVELFLLRFLPSSISVPKPEPTITTTSATTETTHAETGHFFYDNNNNSSSNSNKQQHQQAVELKELGDAQTTMNKATATTMQIHEESEFVGPVVAR